MPDSKTLILSPHARMFSQNTSIVVDSLDTTHVFTGRAASILRAVRYDFDGFSTISEIAHRSSISERELMAVLSSLVDHNVLIDVTSLLGTSNARLFLEQFYPICDSWGRDIFSHPFWTEFASGKATYNTVIGWGVEFFHRVMGADEHNAIAMHCCHDSTIKSWLIEHFDEESDHGTMFLNGLAALGLDPLAVEATLPLPSTRGLISYLNGLAASNLIAYLGCYAVMHSPRVGQTAARINEQFDHWTTMYPDVAPLFSRIREHALLDVGLGHDQIVLERVLLDKVEISNDERSTLLVSAHGITHAFNNFFRGIRIFYGELNGALPTLSTQSE